MENIQTIVYALSFIDATVRDIWVKVLAAIKSEFGEAGRDMAETWSASADNYRARDFAAVWKSINESGGINIGTLFHYAKQGGYIHNTTDKPTPPTAEQIAQREAKRKADADAMAKRRAAAASKAKAIWEAPPSALEASQPSTNEHPYIKRKGIKPYGAKVYRGSLSIGGMDCNGSLMLPMMLNGKITSLQFINKDSEKRFLPDGEKGGYLIGKFEAGKPVCICEGLATGASIHEATGYPVIVAFDAGNMKKIATALRANKPDMQIIFCADDDESGTGQRKANEAAQLVGGLVAMPVFGEPRLEGVKDFNDMAIMQELDAVKLAIESARLVTTPVSIEGDLSGLNNEGDTNTPPEPLPALPDVLPFDYAYLPDGLRGFVLDISERMQCPPDFAAVAVMVMMGTIIGRKVGIRPMRHDDWTVICNLWGAVVGNSGVMKSPTLGAALMPIGKLAKKALDDYHKAISEHEAQAEIDIMKGKLNKEAAKKVLKNDQSADVKSMLQSNEKIDAPILKRYKTNNASYEKLGEVMMENPNGILVEADEIIGLLKQLDASGQEIARSFYLTAADGDKAYTFDRIMRGTVHIDALCLSIIGGIQPGVLAEYVRQATGGGAGADGLLQRFGLMVYPDISPDWKEVDRYPDSEIRQAVNLLAERLDKMTTDEIGAESGQFGGVPFLRFDDAAQKLFSEWRATLEIRLRSGEEHPAIVSHLSKYRKLIPSLALINHLCDTELGAEVMKVSLDDSPIMIFRHSAVSELALLRAISFGDYLESHAKRIYSYATRPDIDAAKTLLKRLESGKLSSPFKARDIYQKGWAGLENPTKTQSAINLLMEYHHLQEEEITTGGRPTAQYHRVKKV